jgi:simple sugar transport system permease protein
MTTHPNSTAPAPEPPPAVTPDPLARGSSSAGDLPSLGRPADSRRIDATAAATALVRTVGPQLAAFVLSMALVLAMLTALGYDPGLVLTGMVNGAAGSPFAISTSLTQAVPLLLTATAVWLAFQAGLFNIGGDGQLQVGGLTGLLVAVHLPGQLPGILVAVLAVVSGAVAGALWAGIAGVLRAYRGANEVISTIMLNFIATGAITLLTAGPLRAASAEFSPRTDRVPPATTLGDVVPGLPLTFIVAVILCLAVVLTVRRTSLGLRLRAVGLNGDAAVHGGLRVDALRSWAFVASGALAGVAGSLIILGYRYYIAPGWAPAWGFLGIVIAFMALRTPLLLPVWAVVLGMIGASAPTLKGTASVPDAITTVMQGLPVVCLFLLVFIGGRAWRHSAAGLLKAAKKES